MKRYASKVSVRLPLLIPAFFSAVLSFVMVYICLYRLSVQGVPAPVEKLCILIIAGFLGWLAVTFVKTAFRDFYREILIQDDSLTFVQPSKTMVIAWEDIRHVSLTSSTLLITTNDGRQIGLGADISDFTELKEHIQSVVNEIERKRIR